MSGGKSLAVTLRVEQVILTVRSQRVILDTDLRSQIVASSGEGDWPRISIAGDSEENRSQLVTGSQRHRNPRYRPYAFTEHGALMAANVLRSPRAAEMSVFVVRAFVRLRHRLADHAELSRRLDDLERKYDSQFKVVFEAIRQLMTPPARKRKQIGFHVREPRALYRTRRRGRSSCWTLMPRPKLNRAVSGAS
jgi:hypothetical protein